MQLCKFCREAPNEATTTLTVTYNREWPCCDDCYSWWQQEQYDNYQAEQAYEEYERTGELASIDHARLLGRTE